MKLKRNSFKTVSKQF